MCQQGVEIYTINNSPVCKFVTSYLQEITDLIMMGKTDLKQLTGKKTVEVIVPLNKMHVGYLFPSDNNRQIP